MSLAVVRTVAELRTAVSAWRAQGQSVGMVPTMGALHDGHLSLIAEARARADRVLATVFVNPAQFAQGEDFEAYPRGEARDAALLAEAGCDLLYAPRVTEISAQSPGETSLGPDSVAAIRPSANEHPLASASAAPATAGDRLMPALQ